MENETYKQNHWADTNPRKSLRTFRKEKWKNTWRKKNDLDNLWGKNLENNWDKEKDNQEFIIREELNLRKTLWRKEFSEET